MMERATIFSWPQGSLLARAAEAAADPTIAEDCVLEDLRRGVILVQLAETPDGVRYVSMAKGLVKPTASYSRSPRRYAVALGCEIDHAGDFVYADQLALKGETSATPIGISCRVCPRAECEQRAFPPAGRSIVVDPDRRMVVPYSFM